MSEPSVVPYHYTEYAEGHYILKEMKSEEAAKQAANLADYLGRATMNHILWGKPGGSETGLVVRKTRLDRYKPSTPKLVGLILGCAFLWFAGWWLYFHGIPLWLR